MNTGSSLRDIRPRARPSRSMGGPRQRSSAVAPRRWLRGALIALLLVLAGAAVALLVRSGVRWVVNRPMFEIRHVEITGDLDQLDRDLLRKRALALRGSFFSLDLRAAAAELRSVPWVRTASVRRVWPDGLEVAVEEQHPVARWGENELLNSHGERFVAEYGGVLPYFQGPRGSEQLMLDTFTALRQRLVALPLAITDLELSERGAWRMTADNGLEFELGREDIQGRLARFITVYPQLMRIAPPAGAVADLRYTHGFALRMPGATKDSSS